MIFLLEKLPSVEVLERVLCCEGAMIYFVECVANDGDMYTEPEPGLRNLDAMKRRASTRNTQNTNVQLFM